MYTKVYRIISSGSVSEEFSSRYPVRNETATQNEDGEGGGGGGRAESVNDLETGSIKSGSKFHFIILIKPDSALRVTPSSGCL